MELPVAQWLPIHRSREDPKPVTAQTLCVRSEQRVDGYVLESHIPAAALTGFDPEQFGQLGFCYAVADRELGWQTFSVGSEFAFAEDPSLWGTLQLERAKKRSGMPQQ